MGKKKVKKKLNGSQIKGEGKEWMRDGEMKGKSGRVMSEPRAMGCGFKCLNERKTEKVILRKVRKRDMNLRLATQSSFIFLTPSICQHLIFLSQCN